MSYSEPPDVDCVAWPRRSNSGNNNSRSVSSEKNPANADPSITKNLNPSTPAKQPEDKSTTRGGIDKPALVTSAAGIEEKPSRKRPIYQLEFLVHKKQKCNKGEQSEVESQKHVNVDSDDQSSDIPFDIEVIGHSKSNQVSRFFNNVKNAQTLPHQTDHSLTSSQDSSNNTLTQREIEARIEKRVIAKVNSSIETLRKEMSKKEKQMQQMVKSFRESITTGSGSKVKPKYQLRSKKGKAKNIK